MSSLFLVFLFLVILVVPWLFRRYLKGKTANPVAEAHFYLAYGQKKQAIHVLKEALVADPGNQDILNKLREIES